MTVRLVAHAAGGVHAARRFLQRERGGGGGVRHHRVGDRAGRARDDGCADDPGGGSVDLRRRLSDRCGGDPAHRARRRRGGTRRGCGARDALLHRRRRARRARRDGSPPIARASGRDARRRSAPWAGWRRISSCRMRWCRARVCRRSSPRSRRIGQRARRAGVQRLPRRRRQPASRTSRTTRAIRSSRRTSIDAMKEIMQACIDAGGTITGEHGIGLDKLPYMDRLFSDETLGAMCALRSVFDPDQRSNPGKVVPVHSCREWHGAPSARRRLGVTIDVDPRSSAQRSGGARARRTRHADFAAHRRRAARGSTPAVPCRADERALARRAARRDRVRARRLHHHRARRDTARRDRRGDRARGTVARAATVRHARRDDRRDDRDGVVGTARFRLRHAARPAARLRGRDRRRRDRARGRPRREERRRLRSRRG